MSGAVVVVQARTTSSRFPRKVLAELLGQPLVVRLVERLRLCRSAAVVVATSVDPSDDELAAVVAAQGVECVRGPLDDVLSRYVQAAGAAGADPVVRITADCPLADPALIDEMLDAYAAARERDETVVYMSNIHPPTYPDGLDVEIVARDALASADRACCDAAEREHVTLHLARHPDRYRHVPFAGAAGSPGQRWTVDYPQDLEFVRSVYAALYPVHGPSFGHRDVLDLLRRHPELQLLQADARRNEALAEEGLADLAE